MVKRKILILAVHSYLIGSYLEHSNTSYSEVLTFKIMLIVKVLDGITDMSIISMGKEYQAHKFVSF